MEAAGLPPGVINLVTGDGLNVSKVALADPDLAGIHFTGSTATFQHLWQTVGTNLTNYRAYPRLVGRLGQGLHPGPPECGSASAEDRDDPWRLRIPGPEVLGGLARLRAGQCVEEDQGRSRRDHRQPHGGDVTDLSNFMGAVIDARAFEKHKDVIDSVKADKDIKILAGGSYDDLRATCSPHDPAGRGP